MSSSSSTTPRQKMINMMYLVLTALLALNVSAEVLKAFKIVNESIAQSNNTLAKTNSLLISKFDQRLQNDPKKVAPIHAKALQAKQISQSTYDYLETLKQKIVQEAGGYDLATGMIKNADDINIATRYFVEQDGKNGKELRNKLEESRKLLGSIVSDANERKEIEKILNLDTKSTEPNKPWEYNQFNHMPAVAAITVLSKYQNDLKNVEAKILENLYKSIDEADYKVDAMKACVISPSNRLLQGDKYEASIMVAAYSSTQSPSIYLGSFNNTIKKNSDGTYPKIENASSIPLVNPRKIDVNEGIGKINMDASTVGNQRYTGVVEVKKPDGEGFDYYPFEGSYEVAPKLSSVSPTLMNVFYIGVDNPVDIAVGATGSEIIPSISMGSLNKTSNGKYNARFTSTGTATIQVKAKVGDKVFDMGTQNFKVKKVPTPFVTLNGVPVGTVSISKMKTLTGLVAQMPPDFEYQVKPTIISYRITLVKKDAVIEDVITGPVISNKILSGLKNIKKDEVLIVESINVLMPGNERRPINSISYIAK
jgi:hypothetical protein